MNPAEKDRHKRDMLLRRLEQSAAGALSRLKQRYPNDYPILHLRLIERCHEIGKTLLTLPSPALPSSARFDYAISLMDAWAGGYLPLVSTLADHDDYAILLDSYKRKAWEVYRGDSAIEPLAHNRQAGLIQERSMHWYKEGLRRLLPAQQSKEAQPKVSPPNKSTLPPRSKKRGAQFPNRAAWLRQRLEERGWDHNAPPKHGGPDRKTVLKILEGEDVRADVLEKLAKSLSFSSKVPKVTVISIPTT